MTRKLADVFQPMFSFASRHRFSIGVASATVKTGGCDLLVQKFVEKKEEIDWRRCGVFTCFGFVFTGCWQYFLFVKTMPRIFPDAISFIKKPIREKMRDAKGLREVAYQNLIENGINNPLLYFPCFYTIQSVANGGTFDPISGLRKYRDNMHEDLPAIWSVWIPAQLFNFAFSPLWFRVPFVSFVSGFWTCYVSITRGNEGPVARRLTK